MTARDKVLLPVLLGKVAHEEAFNAQGNSLSPG